MTDRYPVRYEVKASPLGWTKDELGENGGADALLLVSIMFEPDGGRSDLVLSVDGRTGSELADIEVFKSWVMLAHKLMASPELTDEAKALCTAVFASVQARVLESRDN